MSATRELVWTADKALAYSKTWRGGDLVSVEQYHGTESDIFEDMDTLLTAIVTTPHWFGIEGEIVAIVDTYDSLVVSYDYEGETLEREIEYKYLEIVWGIK